MKDKRTSEKYNIILIVLLFVVSILAINISYYIIASIDKEWEKKEQQERAIKEAETLATESDFSNQLSIHFRKFFDVLKSDINIESREGGFFPNHLEQSANNIFSSPFPKYNLFVVKIASGSLSSELLLKKGEANTGKKSICFAFEYLYNLSEDIEFDTSKLKNTEAFAKSLIGQFVNPKVIAREMKGISTHTRSFNKYSWFIWDYVKIENKGVYGVILTCDEIANYQEYGRLLALKSLKSRGNYLGAFLPIYKNYGKPIMHNILKKSKEFMHFADDFIIKDSDELEIWLKNSFPQGKKVGNYSAFFYMERGDTHVAVVFIRSLKDIAFPKWLIIFDFLLVFSLVIILYLGICFDIWPKISLKTRFILSYVLASILPLSLLSVTSYSYLLQYRKTLYNQTIDNLQSALQSIEYQKSVSIKKYRETFQKAINDKLFIQLLKDKGVEDQSVGQCIINIFEKGTPGESLPLLGVKVLDDEGRGFYLKGSEVADVDVQWYVKSFSSCLVNLLRDKIRIESNDYNESNYPRYEFLNNKDTEEFIANESFKAVTGGNMDVMLNKFNSEAIPRRNGDFCSLQIYDFIKIDGKTKYMLFVVWDDKTLDDRIIKEAIYNRSIKDINQNKYYTAIKFKGINSFYVDEKNRQHASKDLSTKISELAKLASITKKPSNYIDGNTIISILPSLNYSHVVLVGWGDKIELIKDILTRAIVLLVLFVISIIILVIYSIKSASIFLKPISALKNALNEVAYGNLNIVLQNEPKDELGSLSKEVTSMIDGLREKDRLSKLISDHAIKALQKHSNGLLNDTETFNGVALVSDIRNFTGMSEKYDPILITDLLNEHFAEMAKIISDNGGLIYKFIGDAIEAVFPEKEEIEQSASDRAFIAGCSMIAKLVSINSRRAKKRLFQYRIGVGLCKGTMYSGTVGSLETRIDYAILGDPLKKAAKFEALSIQNPPFPIVVGEDIAEDLVKYGFKFLKIDNNGQDFSVYTIDSIINNNISSKLNILNLEEIDKDDKVNNNLDNMKVFSLQGKYKNKKNNILFIFIFLFIASFITIGAYYIYNYTYDNLKLESDRECSRLCEQLKADTVNKAAFETLCLDFYEDISNALNSNDGNYTFDQIIKKVDNKYKQQQRAMPKYYCCLFGEKKNDKIPIINFVSEGFKEETVLNINELAFNLVNRGKEKIIKEPLNKIMKGDNDPYNVRALFFRRSGPATIDDEDLIIDTNKIFNKDHSKIIAYVFCGMPKKYNKNLLDYYTLLAREDVFLAFYDNNANWKFSDNFTKEEKDILINNYSNKDFIREKGYCIDLIELNNKKWIVYAIKKDLALYYQSPFIFIFKVFMITIILLFIIIYFNNRIIGKNESLTTKLRSSIISSAILPLITFSFVSYLFITEDYNVKRSEIRAKLNRLMDEVENRELYYNPYCSTFLKELANSQEIKNKIREYEKIDSDKDKKDFLDKENKDFQERITKENSKIWDKKLNYSIKELFIRVRSNFNLNFRSQNKGSESIKKEDSNTNYEQLLSEVANYYLNNNVKSNKNVNNSTKEATSEIFMEELVKLMASGFGNDFVLKYINFPNNLSLFNVTFSYVGILINLVPEIKNPDYVLVALIFFQNELRPHMCNLRNDSNISLKDHLDSGSVDDNLYCFYSPNMNIGEYFFYDDWKGTFNYNNQREDLRAVKELDLAAFLITNSFSPVSKTIELCGTHLLEARQGNFVKDNVFIAIGSEIPIRNNAYFYLYLFGSIFLIFIVMIYFITQTVISDLLFPVKQLIKGAKSAARGRYDFRINFFRGDELGALCDSFDKMMKGLEEKLLINRMVSKTALKVSSNIKDIDSKKEEVVLLYVTVPNFDKIMKSFSSYELFYKLKKQIAVISEIVINTGGDIDKIMGEKLLIAFHLGNKTPNEVALAACNAAYLIETSDKLNFKVSVGVNYGQVISGFLGVGDKRDFTVIGDPVNVAARIAVFAEKLDSNRRVVSEQILNLIGDSLKSEEYGEVSLKGKSLPLKVYRIV